MPQTSIVPTSASIDSKPYFNFAEEIRKPIKRPPFIIDPLLRVGETMNLVVSESLGSQLIVPDLATKISGVNQALGFAPSPDYQTLWVKLDGGFPVLDNKLGSVLHTENLHGRHQDIDDLNDYLNCVPEGKYKTLILDPVDVFLKDGQLYQIRELHNMLDAQAYRLGSAFILVQHLAEPVDGIRDLDNIHLLGVDTILLLQPSENGLCMEALGRSFAQIEPTHIPMPSIPRGIISLNPKGDL